MAEAINTADNSHILEPDTKKRKLSNPAEETLENLKSKLGATFCCTVCLELPRAAIYQCAKGHLMCSGCTIKLLADARFRDETAGCPSCRVKISNGLASRSLAVEKAVSELPHECQYCQEELPSSAVALHEATCDGRNVGCPFFRIGCTWRGPFRSVREHESSCEYPRRSGAQVMESLKSTDDRENEVQKRLLSVFDLMNAEDMIFFDLQFIMYYRTEESVQKLYYKTTQHLDGFDNIWVVKACISDSSTRDMAYQLVLKTKNALPLRISYFILKGFGDMKVEPQVYQHLFTDEESKSPYGALPLYGTDESIVSSRTI